MWEIQKVVKFGDYLYALVPGHPSANENGYALMHRIIMENHLGRNLQIKEVVHHINGNKHDNRVKNLRVMDWGEHTSLHGAIGRAMVSLRCPQCKDEFEKAKSKIKKDLVFATFCSRSCSAKFLQRYKHGGLTDEMKEAISKNVLNEYVEPSLYVTEEVFGVVEGYDDYKLIYNSTEHRNKTA